MQPWKKNLVVLLVFVAAANLAYFIWATRTASVKAGRLPGALSPGSASGPAEQGIASKSTAEIAAWRAPIMASVELRPVEGAAVENIAEVVHAGVDDSKGILTADQSKSLARAIAAELHARASTDLDEYMFLAQVEDTRWLGPSDEDFLWARIGNAYEGLTKRQVDRREAKEACRFILQKTRERQHSRLIAVGTGEYGLHVVPFIAEHEGDITSHWLGGDSDHAYWEMWSTPATLMFRRPARTPAECLTATRTLKCAVAGIVCESESKRRYPMISTWFLDEGSGRWRIQDIYMKGPPVHALVY